MITDVQVTERVEKQLKKLPEHIVRSFRAWQEKVQTIGLEEVRKIAGYHDEPLSGARAGQRSIRLNRSYRAFYVIKGAVAFVEVIEINKHKY